ncbi:hypothetical protein B0A55_08696 [Friedmanniomyces simplex]|uniref:Uncharacterized protein n=1 Tax=Friedmanniomyces simplex TaxID=329884 RepID=A0A4U0WV18_9PEZI|nr:hypothetical protein B0A55_08696 [Friedmanniomyces simplex]
MPSMEMLLTWVVRVDAVFLGAHLEAYIKLLPTTQTLRLCHRFGIGENVHIHRLPTELVAHIEGYLIKEESRPTEAERFLSNYCFTGECDPVHHHSKEQLLRLPSHYLPGREDSARQQPRDTVIPLTPEDRHALKEYMADDYPEND